MSAEKGNTRERVPSPPIKRSKGQEMKALIKAKSSGLISVDPSGKVKVNPTVARSPQPKVVPDSSKRVGTSFPGKEKLLHPFLQNAIDKTLLAQGSPATQAKLRQNLIQLQYDTNDLINPLNSLKKISDSLPGNESKVRF